MPPPATVTPWLWERMETSTREASEILEKGHFSVKALLPGHVPFVRKLTLFCSPMYVAHYNSKSVTEGLSQ